LDESGLKSIAAITAAESRLDADSGDLDYRSLINYTMMVSSILYFQRNTTGAALISSKY